MVAEGGQWDEGEGCGCLPGLGPFYDDLQTPLGWNNILDKSVSGLVEVGFSLWD